MPIPDFQSMLRPLLALHADGQKHSGADRAGGLATRFGISEEERQERIPSGQRRFDNRVAWTTTHLFQAGLLERPRRGVTKITARGRELLEGERERIDLGVLRRYPEYQAFRARSAPPSRRTEEQTEEDPSTPEEVMERSYEEIRAALAEELLNRIKEQSFSFFEQLVLDVLHGIGYGGRRRDLQRLGRSGDEGLDGVIREDQLGLDVIYVQAKRWQGSVGRPVIQAFVGALQGARASKGVLITTSTFTADAQSYAATVSPRVILVDGQELAELMVDHGVGVSLSTSYEIKKVDEDYFAPIERLATNPT